MASNARDSRAALCTRDHWTGRAGSAATGLHPVNSLSESEAAYLAGIIDGEGTVTLTRTHRGENRRPVVSISSAERRLLDYVLKVVSAGRITNKIRTGEHHSPSVAYVWTSRK